MKKTIYNVFVDMKSQQQCDRMKQLCIDNGLSVDNENTFEKGNVFRHSFVFNEFGAWHKYNKFTKATEAEFIELLKDQKNGRK